MKMVQSLHVGGIASSILWVDFHLVWAEASCHGLVFGDSEAPIYSREPTMSVRRVAQRRWRYWRTIGSQSLPRGVDFRACGLSVDVLVEECTVESDCFEYDVDIFQQRCCNRIHLARSRPPSNTILTSLSNALRASRI